MRVRDAWICAPIVFASACTYGPEEQRAAVTQVIPLGDSYRAIAVVRHDAFQRPTGLSTFPDGGKWRYLRRRGIEYLLDSRSRVIRRLASQEAPDSMWESFAISVVGLEGDTVVFLRMTGCPKGGECHPALQRQRVIRLSTQKDSAAVSTVPADAALPGVMAARRPGERNYVRYRVVRDTITARFDEDGPTVSLFHIRPDGSLEVIGG